MSDVVYGEDAMSQEDAMNMSDKQALKILKPMRDMMRDQHGCPISDAYFALERAIDALTTQQWIPCSERLPEEGAPVLGSFEVEGDRFILTTSIFVFDEKKGKSWTGTMGLKPIAWMPLPEPYKEENDG